MLKTIIRASILFFFGALSLLSLVGFFYTTVPVETRPLFTGVSIVITLAVVLIVDNKINT